MLLNMNGTGKQQRDADMIDAGKRYGALLYHASLFVFAIARHQKFITKMATLRTTRRTTCKAYASPAIVLLPTECRVETKR